MLYFLYFPYVLIGYCDIFDERFDIFDIFDEIFDIFDEIFDIFDIFDFFYTWLEKEYVFLMFATFSSNLMGGPPLCYGGGRRPPPLSDVFLCRFMYFMYFCVLVMYFYCIYLIYVDIF